MFGPDVGAVGNDLNLSSDQGASIMIRRRVVPVAALILVACLGRLPLGTGAHAFGEGLPERLADQEFWKLSSELSEANGSFRSDNLLSNEVWLQYVIPAL